MADGQRRDADESWTDVDGSRAEPIETTPIRYGTVLGGRYAVDKIIGRGGCGLVVRAHDRDLRVSVAIKIVRAELAGERVWTDRLAREVKLARQIQHPHVCRVFDFEQADGRAFLVMELAERGSLRDEMRAETAGARTWTERIADARAVVSALAAIHGAGIVHRDLTPQNLLRMADGRLVLSDFGLATDAGASTTNVHGGTITYMAPELLRGGRATIGSDIWALGVVMHEIVFGARPRWRDGASSEMLPPERGRKLTRAERAVFETCRACTATEARRRIATAAEAGRRLTEGGGWRGRWLGTPRRGAIAAVALTVGVAVGVSALLTRQKRSAAPTQAQQESPLIIPSGEPADWTDTSTVLVEVPARIACTRLLPDKHTIRFVWGSPPRAEEIDTVDRKRVSSPLVPAAYAEGCPDLSPDGTRLVFQGHMPDGRAFAFLSGQPDGRDAVPVVQTAEPSMSSEPTWLEDSQAFSFDIDTKHAGVFLVATGRAQVLPDATTGSSVSMFRYSVGNRVFITTVLDSEEMEVTGFAVPQLKQDVHFRVPHSGLDFTSAGSSLYYAGRGITRFNEIIEIDLGQSGARRMGQIRDQSVWRPMLADLGLAFVSTDDRSDIVVRNANGQVTAVTRNARVVSVSHCGGDLIVSGFEGGRLTIQRVDLEGRILKLLSPGPSDHSPACSPDGRVWYYIHTGVGRGLKRCSDSGCSLLAFPASATYLSMSPDGTRLAFVDFEGKGPTVKWIGAEGGDVHDVIETETGCPIGWTSSRTLWVSRRHGTAFTWTEVDVDSRRETGRTHPGTRDCSDGRSDPESPVDPDLRIINQSTSQLRLLPRNSTARN